MMQLVKSIIKTLRRREQYAFLSAVVIFIISLSLFGVLTVYSISEYVGVEGGALREGVYGQPVSINPGFAVSEADKTLVSLLFAPMRELMDSVEVKESGRVYSIKLKEGLVWDNEQPLTSDDVIFTLKTIQDPLTQSFIRDAWQGVAAERVSELQINITLQRPSVFFKTRLESLRLIPEHAFGSIPPANIRLSGYNLEPIGNGPFRFASFEKRKDGFIIAYTLEKNPFFVRGAPMIDKVRVQFYTQRGGVSQAFRVRDVDAFLSTEPTSAFINQKQVHALEAERFYAGFFNLSNEWLKSNGVRKALSLGVDREKLSAEIGANAFPAESLSGASETTDYRATSSKEWAKSLLSDEKNQPASSSLRIVTPDIDFLIKTAQHLKKEWAELGVQSDVTQIEISQVNNMLSERAFDVFVGGQVLESPYDLHPFWHSSESRFPGLNISGYSNGRADVLMERSRRTPEIEGQALLRNEVISLINEDVPAVFLYKLPFEYIASDKVGGIAYKGKAFSSADERFSGIEKWYVSRARVIKRENGSASSSTDDLTQE